ncbi:MAG TPA: LLM class F420-dependent oxidoreductase [Microbacteriaceae bacterium]
MELGLHNANFTWDSGVAVLGPELARTARAAEAAGIARLTVMDHLWQIDNYGPPEREMLEAYTTLGFLAAHTERVLLHTLVTGVVYREPGLLAKQITTLDVLSGGRAGLGIGAAWNEAESHGLGLPFPSISERFERLEEAVRICLQMWSDDDGPFDGEHYRLTRTLSSPQSLSRPRPYLMIGGGGERKTLKLVARYADGCNVFGGPEASHKLDVLKAHCDAIGRDYDEIEKTTSLSVDPSVTRDGLLRQLAERRSLGFTVAYISSKIPDPLATVDLLASVVTEVAGE